MADWNSKQALVTQIEMMELSHTKNLKAVMFWIQKKMCKGRQLDLPELKLLSINLLICEMAEAKEKKGLQTDSKLYYPQTAPHKCACSLWVGNVI